MKCTSFKEEKELNLFHFTSKNKNHYWRVIWIIPRVIIWVISIMPELQTELRWKLITCNSFVRFFD